MQLLSDVDGFEIEQERARQGDVHALFEKVVAYGLPPCAVCFNLPPAERPEPSGFFNEQVTQAVNLDAETLSERKGPTLCNAHRTEWVDHAPEATHLVEVTLERYESHPMQSAWTYTVDTILKRR